MEIQETEYQDKLKEQARIQKRNNSIRKHLFCYGLLAIPIIHFLIFWVYVNAQSFFLAFRNPDTETGFTLDNFRYVISLFTAEKELLNALINTLKYYFVHLFTGFAVAPFFAYCLYKKIAGHKLFSILFMVPMMVSSIIMIAVFKNFIKQTGPLGIVYKFLTGDDLPQLLYRAKSATNTIIAYVIWTGFGVNLILFSGAMAKIDPEVIECTQLEGIGFLREFASIEFPLIWPTFSISLLLSVNGIFTASGPIIYFTEGMYDTSTITYWFYAKVIVGREFEIASAFGLLLTAAGVPLTLLVQWIRRKIPTEAY